MNVVGLNDTALRALIDSWAYSNLTFGADLYLFKGTMPADFSDLGFSLDTDTLINNNKVLGLAADAKANVLLSTVREAGKVRLRAANGNFATYREKGFWTKADSSTTTFDVQANATQTLGDCVLYYPYGVAEGVWNSNTVPAQAEIRPFEDFFNSYTDIVGLGSIASKFAISVGGGYEPYFGRRASDGALRRLGGGNVSFFQPVEADFISIRCAMYSGGTAQTSQSLSYLQVLTVADTWVDVPGALIFLASGARYRFNFPKQVIKGIRYRSGSNSATGGTSSQFCLKEFGAGLRDYAANPMFDTTALSPYTWGILVPQVDAAQRAGNFKPPMMIMSVGAPASGSDIELTGTYNYVLPPNLINSSKVILELDI